MIAVRESACSREPSSQAKLCQIWWDSGVREIDQALEIFNEKAPFEGRDCGKRNRGSREI